MFGIPSAQQPLTFGTPLFPCRAQQQQTSKTFKFRDKRKVVRSSQATTHQSVKMRLTVWQSPFSPLPLPLHLAANPSNNPQIRGNTSWCSNASRSRLYAWECDVIVGGIYSGQRGERQRERWRMVTVTLWDASLRIDGLLLERSNDFLLSRIWMFGRFRCCWARQGNRGVPNVSGCCADGIPNICLSSRT